MIPFYSNEDEKLRLKLENHSFSLPEMGWEKMSEQIEANSSVVESNKIVETLESHNFEPTEQAWADLNQKIDTVQSEKIKLILSQHEFPLQESAWMAMESLLNQKKKKRYLFYYAAASLLLMLGAALFYQLYSEKPSFVLTNSMVAPKQNKENKPAENLTASTNDSPAILSDPKESNTASNSKHSDTKNNHNINEAKVSSLKNNRSNPKNYFQKIKEKVASSKISPSDKFISKEPQNINTITEEKSNAIAEEDKNVSKFFSNQSLEVINSLPLANNSTNPPLIQIETNGNFNIKRGWQKGISASVISKLYRNEQAALGPALSLFARKRISKRYALEGQLIWKLLQNMNLPSRMETQTMALLVDTDPGSALFYENRKSTLTEVNQYSFFELPLSVSYHFLPRHNISLGLNLSCLLQMTSTNGNLNSSTPESLGLSRFDLGALIGYEWKFSRSFALQIQYNIGFFNLSKNVAKRREEINQNLSQSYQLGPEAAALFNGGNEILPVSIEPNRQEFIILPSLFYNNDLRIGLKFYL